MSAKRQGLIAAAWPLVVAIGVAVLASAMLKLSSANATPGFARQTGLSCQACHTVYPELTAFGRRFKMNAYVFSNVRQLEPVTERGEKTLSLSDLPPISVQLQGSNTWLAKAIPDTNPTLSDMSNQNTTEFPQALSLFYTGKIADYLGSFLQLTWNQTSNAVGIDNSELRFANHGAFGSIGLSDFIYGLSFNNNPTSQDVWNSTPAWGYPFITTNVGVPPIAKPILVGQLSQQSAGFSAYVFLFNHLYLEGGAYWSAQTSFTNATTGGPGPLDSSAPLMRISGSAPYWRVAWEQDWGNHALSIGTYGISAPTHPTGIGNSGPVNTFTDIAFDAQYQYITDNHLFSVYGTWINEHRHFDNHDLVDHTNNWLNTGSLGASYFFRRKIGGYVQAFSTTGTADSTLYAAGTQVLGSASGKPNTQGYLFELNFLPWLNTKLGAQYTVYTRFNGRADNYDGFSRHAHDNNTVFVYVWTAF
jgi:hypothetical protein